MWRGSIIVNMTEISELESFAQNNGLGYDHQGKTSMAANGIIFSIGQNGCRSAILYRDGPDGREFEIGQFSHQITAPAFDTRVKIDHRWRYACIDLKRNLPHIVLYSKTRQGQSRHTSLETMPVVLPKEQITTLEGNFSDYFTLYAPLQYDIDVRYIFTPDVMGLMIDNVASFDAEIVDDKLYFYIEDGLMPPMQYTERLLKLVQAVGRKVYRQTDYYADYRVYDSRQADLVHESGRRLTIIQVGAGLLFEVIIIVLIIIFLVNW